MRYFVYILLCSDGTYYTGVTNNLERRMAEHENGLNPKSYTSNRRPLKLVFSTDFTEIEEAIAFEKKIKSWSKQKKLALINGDFEKLKQLSKKHF